MDALVGATIDGRYRVERRLGAGGMGTVYCARHLLLDQRVALKVLRADAPDPAEAARRFAREARTAFRIDHPGCVRVTDFGATDGGVLYLVMDYLDGRTLGRELAVDGAMAPARVAHVGAQIAGALEHAAGLGLVHRDLKPDNVMLLVRGADADVAKVLDFGLAKMYEHSGATALSLSPLTRDGMVFGTPEYMSPEQAQGGDVGPPTDVYALGVVCYEMLTGALPFSAEAFTAVLAMHVQEAPEPPSRHRPCPAALEELVLACLAKAPGDRPSAAELRRGLEAAREHETRPRAASVVSASETLVLEPSGVASAAELGRTALGVGAARADTGGPPAAAATPAARPGATALGLGAAPPEPVRATTETGSMAAAPRRRPAPLAIVAGLAVIAVVAAIALPRIANEPARSQAATDHNAPDRAATDPNATDHNATTRAATDRNATDPTATDRNATDHNATNRVATDHNATDRNATNHNASATNHTATDRAATTDTAAASPTTPPTNRPSPTFTRHLRAAEAARKQGNPLRQLAEAHEALELEPGHRRALLLVGDALIASGDRARGCGFLRRASSRSFRDAGCAD